MWLKTVSNMPKSRKQWDRVMAGFKRSWFLTQLTISLRQKTVEWEHIRRIGGGGQSDVSSFVLRASDSADAVCLQTIRTALGNDGDGKIS